MAHRQQTLHNTPGKPSHRNRDIAQIRYEGRNLLRLVPGDLGYIKWAAAKERLLRQTVALIEAYYGSG